MDPKVITLFALLAVAIAEKPYLGFRMPPRMLPFSPHIVGGSEAPKGGYPFIISLQFGQSSNSLQHFCAGSIIDKQWILTAAHCIEALPSFGTFVMKAGKHNIKNAENTEQVVQAQKLIVHENYQGGVGPYDIGLIKLKTPLTFTKEIQPIALPQAGSEPSGDAMLTGWGSTSRTSSPNMPNALQHAKLEYVSIPKCDEAIKSIIGSSPVHKTNVCTGPLDGSKSACSGDSGGPLFSLSGNKPVLTGIVSWGIIPCGTVGAPSVYTKVSEYNTWIGKHMAQN